MNLSLKIGNGIIEVKRLISEWWSPSCLCWWLPCGPGWGQRGRGISSTWWSEEPFFLSPSLSPCWPDMGTWRVKRAPQPCKQKQDFEDRSRRRWWISRRLPVSTRLDLSMPRPGRWWTLRGEKTDKTFRIIKLCDPKVWSERYNWTWGVCTKEEKVKDRKRTIQNLVSKPSCDSSIIGSFSQVRSPGISLESDRPDLQGDKVSNHN